MLWVCRGSSSEWKNHKLLFVRPQLQPPSLKAGNGEDIFSMRNRADWSMFSPGLLLSHFSSSSPRISISPLPSARLLHLFLVSLGPSLPAPSATGSLGPGRASSTHPLSCFGAAGAGAGSHSATGFHKTQQNISNPESFSALKFGCNGSTG